MAITVYTPGATIEFDTASKIHATAEGQLYVTSEFETFAIFGVGQWKRAIKTGSDKVTPKTGRSAVLA